MKTSGKQLHLGPSATEKQSAIFEAASMESAQIKRDSLPTDKSVVTTWGQRDVDYDLGLEKWGIEIPLLEAIPVKQFCAYEEAWEKISFKSHDPVDQQKLLEKYGGMSWKDPDDGEL